MAQLEQLPREAQAPRGEPLKSKRRAFSGWPMAVFAALVGVFAFHACTHMVAAGDTWVALACGRHFVQHGVDTVEPFSANSHEAGPTQADIEKWPGWAQKLAAPFDLETIQKWHPTGWINQNWLTHVIFYRLVTLFGGDAYGEFNYDALVWWKFGVYFLNALAIYLLARVIGASVPTSAGAAAFAMFVGRTFLDIRPAAFANLMVPIFLLALALAVYRNIKWIWLIVPATVFWANVHGGYIYVFIMLVPFLGLHLLQILPRKWTFSLYAIGVWLVLYGLTTRFLQDEMYAGLYRTNYQAAYTAPSLLGGTVFWFILALAAVSLLLTRYRESIKAEPYYLFHILTTLFLFVGLFTKFFIPTPQYGMAQGIREAAYFVGYNQMLYLGVFLASLVVGYLAIFAKERLVRIPFRHIVHIGVAGVAAFLAMVLFNPFHLTNLTHTFEISVSKHAESWRKVNEWKPAFNSMDPTTDMPNPVGEEQAFAAMLIVGLLITAAFVAVRFMRPRIAAKRLSEAQASGEPVFAWPKVDLPLIAVCGLTVWMAIQSRRFIPIAAAAACPILALFVDQAAAMFLFRRAYRRGGRLSLPPVSPAVVRTVVLVAAALTVGFGGWWIAKYKRIYLDPWPMDAQRNSVFMRMTASNVKPFEAGQFIRENELSGNMFNYWTEGGAIAFFQEPDPETGKTPLQLYMDGRAQAAYNHDVYERWRFIKGGGPVVMEAARERRELTEEDYKRIGEWIEGEFAKTDVWVTLMPTSEVPYPGTQVDLINKEPRWIFVKGLQATGRWAPVFMNDNQHLFVNVTTDKGRQLLNEVLADKAKFPNDYSRYLTLANLYLHLNLPGRGDKGVEYAIQAFEEQKTQMSALKLNIECRQLPQHRRRVDEALSRFIEDFIDNQQQYSEEAGYSNRLVAALITAKWLRPYITQSDPTLARKLQQFHDAFEGVPLEISQSIKW